MKKLTSVLTALALCAGMAAFPVSAAEVPEAWFELGYKDGAPYDVKGNLNVEIQDGEVIETTVTHNGTAYPVTAFVGDADQEGMLVDLPFEDAESYGEWLLGGCTFELFIELEGLTEGTSGFFTCVNGGGASLYYRNGGADMKQLQFQIGTTDATGADNTWGAYAGAGASDAKNGPVFLEAGKLLHCVGTYNKDTNMLSVYYNGELGSEGSYGEGDFNLGNGYEDVLGIGLNPAYPSESLGVGCEFRVVGAKLYSVCLSAEEVAAEYANSIASVTGETVVAEEPVVEEAPVVEEPVVEEAPVVEEPVVEEAPVVEEPVIEEVVVEEIAEEAPVVVEAPQTFDFGVIAAVSALLSAAGYALSKKH